MMSGLPVAVETLLNPARVEGLRVEFKADWNHPCGGSALRTACAFANDLLRVNGGYLVFGVDEVNGAPQRPVRGIDPERLDLVQKEIHGACARIEPRYTPVIVVEHVDERPVIVVWCPAGDAAPYEAPESLGKGAARLAYVRTHNGTQEAKGDLGRRLRESSSRAPFDDRAAFDATLDDLSPALLHEHLVQSGSRLANERLDVATLARRLQLSRKPNGHEVPRNAALLFFSDEPTRWFRSAFIQVDSFPTGRGGSEILRQTFRGPLPAQVRAALEFLRGSIVAKVAKHPDRAEADQVMAWPFAALEEALVNAIHHRGYDASEPVKIELLPTEIRIISYPGPVDGVPEDAFSTGDFPPVPGRNRRIAELLKDVSLAEAARTGVMTIRASMRANGSPEPLFRFDEGRSYFEVVLPIHPGLSPREPRSALPLRIGRPAPADEVVGREALAARIWAVLDDQSVVLCGPRGRGVSSILALLTARPPAGVSVLAVDLRGASLTGLVAAVQTWREGQGLPAGDGSLTTLLTALPGRIVLALDHLDDVSDDDWSGRERLHHALLELADLPNVRLVAAVESPRQLPREVRSRWERLAFFQPVSPLPASAALELAGRLVQSLGEGAGATAERIAALSAGNPATIHLLARACRLDPGGDVTIAFDELLVYNDDPTGIATRAALVEARLPPAGYGRDRGATMSALETSILQRLAATPDGMPRLDLIAALVKDGTTRLALLKALRDLELDGWVVDRDSRLSLEHPLIAEAVKAAARRPPPPPASDIPF